MAYEKFRDMTYEELMTDIDKSFEDLMSFIKATYNIQDGLLEVKTTMVGFARILDDVGKTFHRIGCSLKGLPRKLLTETAVIFLNNAHRLKRPTNSLDGAVACFRDAWKSSLVQVQRMGRVLKDDEDVTNKTIHRTMRHALSKMKEHADQARAKTTG